MSFTKNKEKWLRVVVLPVLGWMQLTTPASATILPTQKPAHQGVLIEELATPVTLKKLAMVDISFEKFDIEEISLNSIAFSAMNRQFELLHRNDFIKFVSAHKKVSDFKRNYKKSTKMIQNTKESSILNHAYQLALAELTRQNGLTLDQYKEIKSVIKNDKELTKRFKTVVASTAYLAQ